ncbi:YdcF family protein [Virgibacillus dakarensis]|nr:YdcF family protein [Virgibacillus dakarensis]
MKGTLRLKIFVFSLLGVCLTFLIFYFIWMHTARLEKRKADALIILGYKCDHDQIHFFLKERLDTAIELFEQFHFRFIILSGGAVKSTKSEAEIMRDYLEKRGIPGEKILLETKARNTVYNVLNCRLILKEHKMETCLFVSNSFHIRRMKYITKVLHFPASFYAKRNTKSILKQFKVTVNEIKAFRLTLPWLEKKKNMNSMK